MCWRMTNACGEHQRPWLVAEHTLEELKQVDLGAPFAARFAGDHVLTLQECFDVAKGKLNLYLDCKAVNPEQLAREILAAGMERQVVVYDRPDRLQRIHARAPDQWRLWPSGARLRAARVGAEQPSGCRGN